MKQRQFQKLNHSNNVFCRMTFDCAIHKIYIKKKKKKKKKNKKKKKKKKKKNHFKYKIGK
jgi:hypothetical protein